MKNFFTALMLFVAVQAFGAALTDPKVGGITVPSMQTATNIANSVGIKYIGPAGGDNGIVNASTNPPGFDQQLGISKDWTNAGGGSYLWPAFNAGSTNIGWGAPLYLPTLAGGGANFPYQPKAANNRTLVFNLNGNPGFASRTNMVVGSALADSVVYIRQLNPYGCALICFADTTTNAALSGGLVGTNAEGNAVYWNQSTFGMTLGSIPPNWPALETNQANSHVIILGGTGDVRPFYLSDNHTEGATLGQNSYFYVDRRGMNNSALPWGVGFTVRRTNAWHVTNANFVTGFFHDYRTGSISNMAPESVAYLNKLVTANTNAGANILGGDYYHGAVNNFNGESVFNVPEIFGFYHLIAGFDAANAAAAVRFGVGLEPGYPFLVNSADAPFMIKIGATTDLLTGLRSGGSTNWFIRDGRKLYITNLTDVFLTGTTKFGIGTATPTNALDVVGHTSLRSNVWMQTLGSNNAPVAFLAVDSAGRVQNTYVPSAGGGEANVAGEISVTNSTKIGWVAAKSGVTNQLRSMQAGVNMVLTNQGTNVMVATLPDLVVTTVSASTTITGATVVATSGQITGTSTSGVSIATSANVTGTSTQGVMQATTANVSGTITGATANVTSANITGTSTSLVSQAKFFTPLGATASRVLFKGADGIATNVTSAAASTDYVHADGSVGTPSGSGIAVLDGTGTNLSASHFTGTTNWPLVWRETNGVAKGGIDTNYNLWLGQSYISNNLANAYLTITPTQSLQGKLYALTISPNGDGIGTTNPTVGVALDVPGIVDVGTLQVTNDATFLAGVNAGTSITGATATVTTGNINRALTYGLTNATGTAVTADWNGPNKLRLNLSGTTTISFTNTPAAGANWREFVLELYATTTVPTTTIQQIDARQINWLNGSPSLVNSTTNLLYITFDGTNFIGRSGQDLLTGTGPYMAQTGATFYAATTLSGTAYTNQTIAGVGGANTNFTGQAADAVVYIDGGTTNVNFVAIMPGTAGVSYFPTYIITNLTATSRLISASAVTNRLINLQQYDGITFPITLTNKHTAYIAAHLNGSNFTYAIKQCTNGF